MIEEYEKWMTKLTVDTSGGVFRDKDNTKAAMVNKQAIQAFRWAMINDVDGIAAEERALKDAWTVSIFFQRRNVTMSV